MLNLNRLKKEEILWLYKNYCKHRHRYIEHLICAEKEKPLSVFTERVGFLDIETVGLNANFDYIISYAILSDEEKIKGRVLTPQEVLKYNILDKNLMQEFCRDIRQFDRVVVYFGRDRRHDIPFLRSRCIKAKAEFPLYGEVNLTDLYDICKNKLRLDGYRLGNVCDFLGIPAKQHPLKGDIWQMAKLGDKKALDYVWKHNVEDVISMAKVYKIMQKYARQPKVSI